ncbi:uncharacterized protein LOC143636130 [Bidens hawaiensis]|uniref:uncharacterized protein LOC143636130 n=1 Tax=Bidens hawaiensis TaxID=980011 RepID=UPI00404B1CF5
MKLNPSKCSFGMEERKFLGVIVTDAGFKANLDKVQAIAHMPSPSSLKEVQTLNGGLVALNRFLANHAAKSFPFVSTLRNCLKKAQFKWTAEVEKAFVEVKNHLMHLPTLTSPQAGEPLTLYLSASDIAIGAVLLMDRKNVQTLIYYVSRALTGPETRRLEKWAIELGVHSFDYIPCPTIKGQVLADFVTKVPQNKEQECLVEQQIPTPTERDQVWSLFTDGASSGEGSGAGLRLVNPEGHEFIYAIKLDFKITNNEAEYEAFLAGLRIAKKLGVKHLEARVDSMLIAGQINGTYEARNDVMASYLSQAKNLILQFHPVKLYTSKEVRTSQRMLLAN